MKDYLKLIRIVDLIVIAAIQAFIYFAAIIPIVAQYGLPLPMPYWILASLIAATVFIAAGGFVVNDYFDIKIDRLNRPDNVIVSNSISKQDAMHIYQILTVAGVAIGLVAAIVLKSLTLGFIFVIVAGLLWFYSSSYKRTLILGNFIVAAMTALVPFVPAFAAKEQMVKTYGEIISELPIIPDIYTFCGIMAGIGFCFVFALEVIKDIRDEYGDREMECHTISVVWGTTVARIIATVFVALGCAIAVYASLQMAVPGYVSLRYALCAVVLPAAFLIWFVWTKNCKGIANAVHVGRLLILLAGLYPLIYFYIFSNK